MKFAVVLLFSALGSMSFAQSSTGPIDGKTIPGQVDLVPVQQEGVDFYRLNIKGKAAQKLKSLAKKAEVSGSDDQIWFTESYFCFETPGKELTCNLFVKKDGQMVRYQAEALAK